MGKKLTVDGVECELDDDINESDLNNHPTPENALTDDEIQAIINDESALGE